MHAWDAANPNLQSLSAQGPSCRAPGDEASIDGLARRNAGRIHVTYGFIHVSGCGASVRSRGLQLLASTSITESSSLEARTLDPIRSPLPPHTCTNPNPDTLASLTANRRRRLLPVFVHQRPDRLFIPQHPREQRHNTHHVRRGDNAVG